ncbi:hypothetical protein [Chakrabartyella piscis]|uniref:hypothetical protein n=1 Tax=Chakrabartyella piscis TaxID=2918914 RepID=UPI002958801A|nr:hypothetical protein [Chakrabartyella piscis]
MTKAEAIHSLCEYLRSEGYSQINDYSFEETLRQFIINNGYFVRGFGKDTETNSLEGSTSYTRSLIDSGKIPYVSRMGSTYILNNGTSNYKGLNTYGVTQQQSSQRQQVWRPSASSQQPNASTGFQTQQWNSSGSYQAPKQTQTFSKHTSQSNASFMTQIRSLLSLLIFLAFVVNIIRMIFFGLSLSNPQFWALPIGLGVTKEALFAENTGFNLLGRTVITIAVWMAVAAFL